MAEARIFEDLKQDHDHHREQLAQLAETKRDSEERQSLFESLRLELQAHAAAEEEALYATMLGCPELRDDARHSVSEHKEIDDMLGELIEIDIASKDWLTKFKEMRHRYLHHIEEEEEEMFPKASEELSHAAEERIADKFKERKPAELERAANEQPGDDRD
jgi:hypothetical protein